MRVKEIFDGKYPTIFQDELATKARAVIRDFNIRILPVINEDREFLGIVSRGDLMAISSSLSAIRVRGIMKTPKYVAVLEDDAFSAVKEMVRLDEWYAPVVSSPQSKIYCGVLGLENFIEAIVKTSPEKLSTEVSEIMSRNVLCCSPEDEVEQVWRTMQRLSLAGCPVVKKDKLIGMVTQKDLLESGGVFPTFESGKGRFRSSPKISSIMTTGVIAVKPSIKAIRVAKIIVSKDIGRIPVRDEEGKLLGIVDREDVARLIIK